MAGTKADEYERHAEDADRSAQEALDPHVRDSWRAVARNWREMAEQAKRNGW